MSRLFVSQPKLDEWIEQGSASLSEDLITLDDGRCFHLLPAVAFHSVVGAETDPHSVLGTVKTRKQLVELSADHYGDSVLIGEVAYQVVEGFVGEPS